jgi:tetratricopeptide (TPR) repeat protein
MDRLESLLNFLEQDPDDAFTLYAIALEYSSRKETDKSIFYLESIIRKDPDYLAAYQQLGHLLAVSNKKAEAIEIYNKGIQVAKKAGDKHAENNLRSLVEELS